MEDISDSPKLIQNLEKVRVNLTSVGCAEYSKWDQGPNAQEADKTLYQFKAPNKEHMCNLGNRCKEPVAQNR